MITAQDAQNQGPAQHWDQIRGVSRSSRR